jgi:hypothetical protein
MGCSCEDGSRDTFIGTIVKVMDKEAIKKDFDAMQGATRELLREHFERILREAKDDAFGVTVKIPGGQMAVGADMFPQTKEWAKSHIGKPLRFTITQLPKRGGMSMDVCEHVGDDR